MQDCSQAKPSTGDFEHAAHAALQHFGLRDVTLELAGFVENVVYKVTSAGSSFVLRLHRPGYHTLAELESEQAWTAALNEAGLAAPRPVASRAGDRYVLVDVAGSSPRYAGLSVWRPGQTMGDLMDQEANPTLVARRFAELGELAAAVHNQAVNWEPPPSFERHALDADGLVGEKPWWGRFWEARALSATDRARLANLRESLRACLPGYSQSGEAYSLIHSDLHPGNVLLHEGQLSIIDFDDAGYGWHAYELAVALYRYLDEPVLTGYRDALLEGYARRRQLPPDCVSQMSVFWIARTLQTIGWINDRPELDKDSNVPALVERADRLAGDIGLA